MTSARITVKEIAADLAVSEIFVYRLLSAGEIPAVRLHKHWLVTRHAYEGWKQNCGTRRPQGITTSASGASNLVNLRLAEGKMN